jgi:predicted RND superfamily exporter protein
MQFIAWIFYGILALACLVSAGFIVFHILRYSLRRSNGIVGAALFILVFSLLFMSNFLLFSGIPFNDFSGNSFLPSTSGF